MNATHTTQALPAEAERYGTVMRTSDDGNGHRISFQEYIAGEIPEPPAINYKAGKARRERDFLFGLTEEALDGAVIIAGSVAPTPINFIVVAGGSAGLLYFSLEALGTWDSVKHAYRVWMERRTQRRQETYPGSIGESKEPATN